MNSYTMRKYFGGKDRDLYSYRQEIKIQSSSTKERANDERRTILGVCIIGMRSGTQMRIR